MIAGDAAKMNRDGEEEGVADAALETEAVKKLRRNLGGAELRELLRELRRREEPWRRTAARGARTAKARSALGVESAGKKKMWNRPSPLNRERGSWASNRWAAAVRFVGRHVAQCYTRGKQKATGWPHGSGTAVRIRCGAINASAEVEGK